MANSKVQLSDGTVLLDLTGDTVTPDTLLEGFTAHGKDGAPITGTLTVPAASIKVTGLSQSDTVTAAMGSKTKTAKWVTVPNPAAHGLPSGYTELESIESTGTQYIDTGVNIDSSLGVEMDFVCKSPVSTTSGEFGSFFGGCKLLNGSINIRVWIGTYKSGSNAGVFDWNTTGYNGGISVGTRMQLSLRNGTYTTSTSVSVTLPTATFDAAQNAYLFAANKGGTAFEHAKVLLYACKVYSGDTLVRDFIPAKRSSDGAIGLYDLVTEAFFANAGTGVFTAGTEVPSTVSYWLIDGIRDFGTWTVTATNGTRTATQDVLVDVITEYEIKMVYRLYLYNEGDECEDVTGGWATGTFCNSSGSYTWTNRNGVKNSDNLLLEMPYHSGAIDLCAFFTQTKVDFSAYSSINIEYSANLAVAVINFPHFTLRFYDTIPVPNGTSMLGGSIAITEKTRDADTNIVVDETKGYVAENAIASAPLPPVAVPFTSPGYLSAYLCWAWPQNTCGKSTLNIKKIWLE